MQTTCILIRLEQRNLMGRWRPFHPSTSMYVYFIIMATAAWVPLVSPLLGSMMLYGSLVP